MKKILAYSYMLFLLIFGLFSSVFALDDPRKMIVYIESGIEERGVISFDGEWGAGIIINWDKSSRQILIATAKHIIDDSDSIRVRFFQNQSKWYPSKIIYKEKEEADLAVIEVVIPTSDELEIPSMQKAPKAKPFQYDEVGVVGHSAGELWSVNVSHKVATPGFSIFNINGGTLSKEGNSGGGVFDLNNRILGMIYDVGTNHSSVIHVHKLLELFMREGISTNLWQAPIPPLDWVVLLLAGGGTTVANMEAHSNYEEAATARREFENQQHYPTTQKQEEDLKKALEDLKDKEKDAQFFTNITATVAAALAGLGIYRLIKMLKRRR